MKLNDLVAAGAFLETGITDREIEWEDKKFTVGVKVAASAADFEFVYQNSKSDDDSYMARRVHRFILLEGGERIPYDKAVQFKTSLLIALCSAINAVHDTADDQKKPSRQKRKSGAN